MSDWRENTDPVVNKIVEKMYPTDPTELEAIVTHIERTLSDVLHMETPHPRRDATLQALGFAYFALTWEIDEQSNTALKRHLDNARRYL